MKYLSLIRYVLLALSVIVVILPFSMGNPEDIDQMLRWAYLLLGLTIATAIVLPLFNLVKNPGAAVRSLIGLAIIAVVIAVSFSASDATPIVTPSDTYSDAFQLRFSDTGLFATYASLAFAVLSIVVCEVYNMFK